MPAILHILDDFFILTLLLDSYKIPKFRIFFPPRVQSIDFVIFADPMPLAAWRMGSAFGETPTNSALRPQTVTEKHQTVAKEQAKGRQTRTKRGQGDAKGMPRR